MDGSEIREESLVARIDKLAKMKVGAFRDMVQALGLNPEKDLRFYNLSGCPFDKQDLAGLDFTGCNLKYSTFIEARIASREVNNQQIPGAKFDLARVSLSDLRKAADFDAWLKADLAREPSKRRKITPARLPDLAEFREAPFAPEMVVIPAGEFLMGSDDSDDEAFDPEKMPDRKKRKMVIPERFALGKYPVTFEEYDLFCAAEKRKPPLDMRGWGRDRRPVINVSWSDANVYARWLNERLGTDVYGLPSEAQWEYACRAGTNTRYWWGDAWDPTRANGNFSFEKGRTSPVGHYGDKGENPFHLSDMVGNVLEWCADAWTGALADLPPDGRPYDRRPSRDRKQQKQEADSPDRALRGSSWSGNLRLLRSAFRDRVDPGSRNVVVGFRLSRTL